MNLASPAEALLVDCCSRPPHPDHEMRLVIGSPFVRQGTDVSRWRGGFGRTRNVGWADYNCCQEQDKRPRRNYTGLGYLFTFKGKNAVDQIRC